MKNRLTIFVISLSSLLSSVSSIAWAEDAAPAKIAVGDRWVYQETDNITKAPSRTITWVVTEVADKSYTITAKSNTGQNILDLYDYNGNGLQYGAVTYTPNDGTGEPANAKVGTTWKQPHTWRNADKGNGGKAVALGKCDANEQLTLPSGTFDALKCVVTVNVGASTGGTKEREITTTSWYAPQALRFVKREVVIKERGHLSSDVVQELTEYHLNDQ